MPSHDHLPTPLLTSPASLNIFHHPLLYLLISVNVISFSTMQDTHADFVIFVSHIFNPFHWLADDSKQLKP